MRPKLRCKRRLAIAYAVALARALPIVAVACTAELPPPGEVLVVVDTDLPVPAGAARLRVDLYSEDGAWYESRDVALRDPSDWPASFGVVARDGGERRVLVRLRVYPEGKVRDYRGERFSPRAAYQPPATHGSINELCAAPAQLPIGGTVTLRRDRDPFIGKLSGGDCDQYDTTVGSNAAVIDVAQPGSYKFGVLEVIPPDYQVTLQLRRACNDESTALACDTGLISFDSFKYEPAELELDLEAGRYYLVTGGSVVFEAPADIVVGAAHSAAWPPADPPAPPTPPEEPKLTGPGNVTPASEPQPLVAVDRLLLVRIVPDTLRATQVTLRGACLGTMAQLEADWPYQRLVIEEASTCVSTEGTREALREAPLEPVGDIGASVQGAFAAPEPCADGIAGSEVVCVPGGFFLLGSTETPVGEESDPIPERAAVMRRFWIDRHEVTVGRFRAALAAGFNPGLDKPFWTEGPLADSVKTFYTDPFCTWSKEPRGREDMALNCVSWYGARAMCRFSGGDLPTEAQWEYVATAAGRVHETTWPWGGDAPACFCDGSTLPCHWAVIGRSDYKPLGLGQCYDGTPSSVGPLPVWVSEGPNGDETPPLDGVNGVVGLVGGMREWVRDAFRPFDHPCWEAASVVDPKCVEDDAPRHVLRGGNWLYSANEAWVTQRPVELSQAISLYGGFRCVYPDPNAP